MNMDFTGLSVALATPFTKTGEVDFDGFKRLVKHCVGGGVDVLIPLGSTGEAATIVDTERDDIIRVCIENAGDRKVVVGCGSNSTTQSAAWSRRAQELGAHGLLVVTPYYNKPTTAGLVSHFEACALAANKLPIIAYNVPGRTGLNMTPEALHQVWRVDQVVAVKESSGNLAQIGEICRTLPKGKQLLSGDDNLALASIAVGASGLVSVLGNILPKETKALVTAAMRGDFAEARSWHFRLLPIIDALFVESNPIPLKAGLDILGICGDSLRLPLVSATDRARKGVQDALERLNQVAVGPVS